MKSKYFLLIWLMAGCAVILTTSCTTFRVEKGVYKTFGKKSKYPAVKEEWYNRSVTWIEEEHSYAEWMDNLKSLLRDEKFSPVIKTGERTIISTGFKEGIIDVSRYGKGVGKISLYIVLDKPENGRDRKSSFSVNYCVTRETKESFFTKLEFIDDPYLNSQAEMYISGTFFKMLKEGIAK